MLPEGSSLNCISRHICTVDTDSSRRPRGKLAFRSAPPTWVNLQGGGGVRVDEKVYEGGCEGVMDNRVCEGDERECQVLSYHVMYPLTHSPSQSSSRFEFKQIESIELLTAGFHGCDGGSVRVRAGGGGGGGKGGSARKGGIRRQWVVAREGGVCVAYLAAVASEGCVKR